MQALGRIKKNFAEYWLLYLIVAQPLLDILAYWQQNSVGTAAGLIRMLVLIILPIYILCTTKKRRSFLVAMGIVLLFCALHILNGFRVGYISIYQDVAYLLRIIQMPILAMCFIHYIGDEKKKELVLKGFLINGLIIAVSMVLAYVTNTGKSTYAGYGVGLNGWFSNTNSQSIILVSLAPLVLYVAVKHMNQICQVIISFIILGALILNGTKACYYTVYLLFAGFMFFLFIDYFMRRKNGAKLNIPLICFFGVLLVFAKVVYPYSPRAKMDASYSTSVATDQKKIDKEFKNNGPSMPSTVSQPGQSLETKYENLSAQLKNYYRKNLDKKMVERFGLKQVLIKYGVTPSAKTISDNRFKKVVYAQCVWDNSDTITKIVGFEYTNMNIGGDCYDLENDWPAIFYYCGYLGLTLYALFVLYFVILILRGLLIDFHHAFTLYNFCISFTFVLQIFLAQYSGWMLRIPGASIYMALFMALIYYFSTSQLKLRKWYIAFLMK